MITRKESKEEYVTYAAAAQFQPENDISQTSGSFGPLEYFRAMEEVESPLAISLRSRDTSPPLIVRKCLLCEKLTPDVVCTSCSELTTNSGKITRNDTQTGVRNTDSNTQSAPSLSTGLGYGEKSKTLEGKKADDGKVGVHLLPPYPLIEIAKVLDFGAKKYDPWNWSKGIKYSRVFGAALRHLWAWWLGRDLDEESGISHLAHAGCCILFLLQYTSTRKQFDDRPIKELS